MPPLHCETTPLSGAKPDGMSFTLAADPGLVLPAGVFYGKANKIIKCGCSTVVDWPSANQCEGISSMLAVKNYCFCARAHAMLAIAPFMVAVVAAQTPALPGPKQAASGPVVLQLVKPAGCIDKLADVPAQAPARKSSGISSYVLADSIGFGLHAAGLEKSLQEQLGGPSKISYDTGRSISSPGIQISRSALESVDIDSAYIANSGVIVVILGTNQMESSFADSQRLLVKKLKLIAPQAAYYWVDIGATISTQVAGWNARNKVIYDQAPELGYAVISRYKAIFGPNADPLNIRAGQNFPDRVDERGYGGPGNIHGGYPELAAAILETVSRTIGQTANCKL